MTDFRHAGLDIRACIRSLAWQYLAGCLIDHNGKPVMDPSQVLDSLVAELAAGREVLPIGRVCGEWDYKTGCKGHAQGDDDWKQTAAVDEPKVKPAATGIAKCKKGGRVEMILPSQSIAEIYSRGNDADRAATMRRAAIMRIEVQKNRIADLESEITRLKQKCNALVTAAKISMVPAAMFMSLEEVGSEDVQP